MPTIVLIHGLWLTARSWEGWKARFEESGHEVLAPAWPHMEGEVEALRRKLLAALEPTGRGAALLTALGSQFFNSSSNSKGAFYLLSAAVSQQVSVVQSGQDGYVVNRSQGTVSRVDGDH